MTTPTFVNMRAPIPVAADRLGRLEQRLGQLQAQIATGERFTRASEAPADALRAAALDRLDARLGADARVLERAATRLGLAETAVAQGAELLIQARELGLAAASGSYGVTDRSTMAAQLGFLRDGLLEAANRRDEGGRFLFAGAAAASPAYAPSDDGAIAWSGLGEAGGAEAAGVTGAALPRGPDLFGPDRDGAFAALDRLLEGLATDDDERRAATLAEGLALVERAHDRMIDGRARIGAALARLDTERERLDAIRLTTAEGLRATRGLDLAQAIAALAALETTLAAARQAFARGFSGTLFDTLG